MRSQLIADHNRLATITPITSSLKASPVNSPSLRPTTIKSAAAHPTGIDATPPSKTTGSPLSTLSSSSPHHANHRPTPQPSAAQTIGRGGNGFEMVSAKMRNSPQTIQTQPPSNADTLALRVVSNGKVPNGIVTQREKEILAAAIEQTTLVETVSKAVGANLGCGGDGNACNGKSAEALGVLIQYLVFHVSSLTHFF